MLAPDSLLFFLASFALTIFFSIIISAPSDFSPLICSLIGLLPILQPPGRGIEASPNLANNAPIQKKLALNPFTSSYGSSCIDIFFESIIN